MEEFIIDGKSFSILSNKKRADPKNKFAEATLNLIWF